MSCFAVSMGAASSSWPSPSPSWMGSRKHAWRRWCAGLAAAARSRLRRVRWAAAPAGHRAQRRRPSSVTRHGQAHRRSFAPVYVDELYSHQQQQPMGLRLTVLDQEEQPSTSKPTTTTAGWRAAPAAASSGVGMKMKGLMMMMSPGRERGGMGEVDLRAEMFIRKFREEMRLQSQRSAEEFQAMLARGT
ncbi:uncharacterized protein LOC100832250 [Brachypodium distachyon]|uniref:uncharacterized protein LOC100832250 n=1 Tax=Brachypodium distachyon TaxID=15368 RepID=UPI000234FA03|nr:uncharacterized protein LOC100832250 [Brachypodium distachyon]|eukprot:XP_003571345.1 uncharacterized protein LOC100832250 [Brachypodium distachyon]